MSLFLNSAVFQEKLLLALPLSLCCQGFSLPVFQKESQESAYAVFEVIHPEMKLLWDQI